MKRWNLEARKCSKIENKVTLAVKNSIKAFKKTC